MDIIFANQSLYYIPLKELKQNILEFYELLNTGVGGKIKFPFGKIKLP